jgi:very-short-patch-repair endonuclease
MLVDPRALDDADELTRLRFRQHQVLSRAQALGLLSAAELRHRVESGRWQQPHRAVYVTHSGELTLAQRRWLASLATGGGRPALLGGLSALQVGGLRGYPTVPIHVLLPASRRSDAAPDGVVVHRTTHLPPIDQWLAGDPPCTMAARSAVDAAQWAHDDHTAQAIIAASFQQRLIAFGGVRDVLDRMPRARRRSLIAAISADAAGGAHSVSELAFRRLCREHGLPAPTRQVRRTDTFGRRRYLDAYFEPWQVHVEIDGGQHMDVRNWWNDMRRQNELWIAGDRVLRFPAWALRTRPREVAAQLRSALLAAGWSPRPTDLGG